MLQNNSNFQYIGNKELLKLYKIAFLCSRKIPSSILLKTYDWAVEQREKGLCIISGFHSKVEKDVFNFLIKGNQPVIMVLARALKKRWEPKIMNAINNKNLLIISFFKKSVKRISEDTAAKRNRYMIDLADKVFIPYASPNGKLSSLIEYINSIQKEIEMFNYVME